MPEYTKCPNCGLSEFSSRSARDNHVYKCKRKSQSTSHSDPFPNSSSQPERKPPEYFTRFDGRKAPLTEAELINESIDWLKSTLTGNKPSPQPEEPIRKLTVTDLAVLRERELNGEISPQFESYTPSSEAQVQSQPAQISSHPHIGDALKSLVSRVFPQKKQPEFPKNSYNEYGQPLFHHKCLSCGNWVSTNDVAIHQANGCKVVYVG